jgi:hypothetical protein
VEVFELPLLVIELSLSMSLLSSDIDMKSCLMTYREARITAFPAARFSNYFNLFQKFMSTLFLNRLVQLELSLETFIGFLVSGELTAH